MCTTNSDCRSNACANSSASPLEGYCTDSCGGVGDGFDCAEGPYTVCVTGFCYKNCGLSGYGDCYPGQTCIGSSRAGYYCEFPP